MRYVIKKTQFLFFFISVLFAVSAQAGDFQPFVLAEEATGDAAAKAATVKEALTQAGFEVVGEYSPEKGSHVIVITNGSLKETAAKSDFGGYGAIQRVGISQAGDKVQVAYTNPSYMANVYRMADNLSGISGALEKALGKQKEFGADSGRSAEDLREYHYMAFMPYFDDHLTVGEYPDHAAALSKVEKGLAAAAGLTQIYRVDIPGKEESVFGVSIANGPAADKAVVGVMGSGELKHTPHLPYEVLVSGSKAYVLHGKFRIALSSPDLGMGTFMQIGDAPDAIELNIKKAIQ